MVTVHMIVGSLVVIAFIALTISYGMQLNGTRTLSWSRPLSMGAAGLLLLQYVLGFETAGTGTPGYHRIAVAVKGRKVQQVTHRKGYKGLAPAPRR